MLKSLLRDLLGSGRARTAASTSGPAPASLQPAAAPAPAPWTPPAQSRHDGRIAVIVPSVASRSGFFARALAHFATCGMRWPIVVTDHSGPADQAALESIAAQFKELDVRILRHEPDAHFLDRIVDCARSVDADYVALHADDDFMLPQAMEKCIDFLDRHADYVVCKGRMAAFHATTGGSVSVHPHEGRSREEDDPTTRVLRHIASFSPTLYAIHRREIFADSYAQALEGTDNVIFWQYLASCLTVLRGKIKTLEDPYYLRLDNDRGWRSQLVAARDKTHWPYLLLADDFSAQLTRFIFCLSEAMPASAAPDERIEAIEDACIWLVRRALSGATQDPPEAAERAFLERINRAGTIERDFLEYCVRATLTDSGRLGGAANEAQPAANHAEIAPRKRTPRSSPSAFQAEHDAAREFLRSQLSGARFETTPFPHFSLTPAFPWAYYALIRKHWPSDENYASIVAKDRVGARGGDLGARKRFFLELDKDYEVPFIGPSAEFWDGFAQWFCSQELREFFVELVRPYANARFGTGDWRIDTYADVIVTRDRTRYALGPHTDLPTRYATFLFYCPENEDLRDLGTTIFVPSDRQFTCRGGPHYDINAFEPVFTAPFVPNAMLGFVKSDRSFHGVRPIQRENVRRDLIQYNLRITALHGGRDVLGRF